MSGREPGRSPDDGLEAVQLELDANNQALAKLEHALERDSRNPYLLKKYERLSKREELLLEERKLWAGAALDSHSWQSGLQAAPGVKALLERLVAASGQQGGASEAPQSLRGQGTGSFLGGSERGGSGRYNTRRGAQFSPDKAQLMLLANAADASGDASPLETRHGRMLSSRGLFPAAKPAAVGRVKPFHVAKTSPASENNSEDGSGVDVPVIFSQEERLAEHTRNILAGLTATPRSETAAEDAEVEAIGSDTSRESPQEAAAAASQERAAGQPAAVAGTASTEGGEPRRGEATGQTAADRFKAQLLSEVQTPEGSTNAVAAATAAPAPPEADEAVHGQPRNEDLKEAEQQMDGSKPAAENADGEANPAPMQIDDDGPNGRSTVASQEHRSVVPPT